MINFRKVIRLKPIDQIEYWAELFTAVKTGLETDSYGLKIKPLSICQMKRHYNSAFLIRKIETINE